MNAITFFFMFDIGMMLCSSLIFYSKCSMSYRYFDTIQKRVLRFSSFSNLKVFRQKYPNKPYRGPFKPFFSRAQMIIRPSVAGAVLQTASSLIDWFSHSSFVEISQDTFTPKPYELGNWHFERMSTSRHVSHVTCHVSRVTCHMSHVKKENIFFLTKWWS